MKCLSKKQCNKQYGVEELIVKQYKEIQRLKEENEELRENNISLVEHVDFIEEVIKDVEQGLDKLELILMKEHLSTIISQMG